MNATHTAPVGDWKAQGRISCCNLPGSRWGEGLGECRQPQDAALVAALWLSWVFNVKRPCVLPTIFSPFQNYSEWPSGGVGRAWYRRKTWEKINHPLPRVTGCLHTISMHCFYFWGNNFKPFSLEEKKKTTHMRVCVYVHTYSVNSGFSSYLI